MVAALVPPIGSGNKKAVVGAVVRMVTVLHSVGPSPATAGPVHRAHACL